MADPEYKIVMQEHVGPYHISTVWLGLDHAFGRADRPIIFETMVFASVGADDLGPDLECRRYSTEEEALAGHAATVLLVTATFADWDTLNAPEDSNGR